MKKIWIRTLASLSALCLTLIFPHTAMAQAGEKILQFPNDYSVGRIYILKPNRPPDDRSTLTPKFFEARGTLKLNPKLRLSLEANYQLVEHCEILRALPPDSFDQMSLAKLPIQNKDLNNLTHFTKLVRLDLNDSDITDGGIKFLLTLHDLQYLNLSHTLISAKNIGILQALPHLQNLDLNHVDLSGTDLAGLPALKDLRYVHFSNCCLTDAAVTNVAKLSMLENVSLPGNLNVSGASFRKMAACKHLVKLDVSGTKVTAKDLEALKGLNLNCIELRQEQGDVNTRARLHALFPRAVLMIKSETRLPTELFRPLH